ncbi:penicillin acylase [Bdellovibrio bacteriovorus]|uniref:Penicillin acylase n=2 Tax=Bdellovibrio bacteriovorus TaxID=959 RepID=A0A150WHZ2_BDEBC|nr:penicillin acylase [Bdellovibrio bacteriovorus]
MDGELKLEGLSQKVMVTRDAHGIPHIKAESKLDALRALGFVMASERLFQMELSRRLTQGRLSEIFGNVALPSDKLYRSLMLRRSAERIVQHLKDTHQFDEQIWKEMEAYFDGINQYVRTQKPPYEFALLGMKPEEFVPMDAYILAGHMSYVFGIALKADPLMTELSKKLSPEKFQALRADMLNHDAKTTAKVNARVETALAQIDFLNLPHFEGSNSWLIAPFRSASGKSIFANDPHIGFSNPSIWVEAHIQTPEFELYGHYLPLIPFAVLGHTRHHAWGFTMSVVDDMDLYHETLDLKNKTVVFKGKPQAYEEWQEIIKVKNEPDVVLDMIETPHGPVMNHSLETKDLSLKWAFHSKTNDLIQTVRNMAEAKTMAEFEKPLQRVTAPGLNVMYADAENIAWWMIGDIALKKNPNSDLILDGASGNDEYIKVLPWKEHPHQVNPASGVIITANSRPDSFPAGIRGDWQPEDRFQTITKLLAEKQIWSAEEFKKIQSLNFNSNAASIRGILLEELKLNAEEQEEYKDVISAFKSWDLHSNIDSQGAAIFHLWCASAMRVILKDLTQAERDIYLMGAAPWTAFKRILFNADSAWFEEINRSQTVTQAFRDMMAQFPRIPVWGELHTIEFYHPLGRMKPLDKIFNVGPYPAPGAYNEINNNKYWSFAGADFKVTAGASTRRIIDMAHPEKSFGVNPIGISGHILSPFRADQVQLFLKGEYRDQLMDDKDIQNAKTHELVLTPL